MKVLKAAAFAGPSYVAPVASIHVVVERGEFVDWPGGESSVALLDLLPGLADHPGSAEGSRFADDLQATPGPRLSLVAARVAVELMRCHRGPLRPAAVRYRDDGLYDHIVFGYDDPKIGLAAGQRAVDIVIALLPEDLKLAGGPEAGFDPAKARDDFLAWADGIGMDQSTAAIAEEAARRGIPWFILSRPGRMVQLGQGRHLRRIRETITSGTSTLATMIQRDKSRTAELFKQMHLPSPEQVIVTSPKAAAQAAADIGMPVVVKPLDGSKGRGITLGVEDEASLRTAFDHARLVSPRVIVERFIAGDDHRVLVVGGRMIAAAKRLPAAVTGDGRQSIAELVAETNGHPQRGHDFSRLMNKIVLDEQADSLLARRGYTRETVPPAGEVVTLRGTANISTGGTAVDVTDRIHPENRIMLERAARVVGLDVAGIDFITPDIGRSYRDVGGAICEVNASPGLRPHQVAALAPGAVQRDVVGPIVDLLFPGGGNGRIPIASITGTNGKTTTSRMLACILERAGGEIGVGTIGLATTAGVTIGGAVVTKGDFAGASGARVVLGDPTVEAAVLETARGGLAKNGLSFDWCDVGAVLNIADDHIGLVGVNNLEDLAALKACVARAARRLAVLNADDPRCLEMAQEVPAARLCLFTMKPLTEELRTRIAAGSRAIVLEEHDGQETIVLHGPSGSEPLIASAAIPATLKGAARHNVANAMAAAGLGLGLGLSPAGIAAGLAVFRGDHEDNPGRLNFIEGFPFTVVHDSAHNPHGMQVACEAIRRLPANGRRICVVAGVGFRHGEHLEQTAAIIADKFDVFLCSRWEKDADPSHVKRDFPLEEVPARLAAALVARGVDPACVTAIDSDAEALERGLTMAREGDLVALLTGIKLTTRERALRVARANRP